MTDKAAFIEAIRAAPDDDHPRLAYCDWLEENDVDRDCGHCLRGNGCPLCRQLGHLQNHVTCYACGKCDGLGREWNGFAARADFIRESIRLFRLDCRLGSGMGCDNSYCLKCGPAYELRAKHLFDHGRNVRHNGHQWLPAKFAFGSEWHWDDRGFIDTIICTWADWRDHADAILAEHPVRKVALTTEPITAEWRNTIMGDDRYRLAGRRREVAVVDSLRHQFRSHESHTGVIRDLLKLEWPGVEFTIPGASPVPPWQMEYQMRLAALPDRERHRLLYGEWPSIDARPAGGATASLTFDDAMMDRDE